MQSPSSAHDLIERPSRLGVFAVIWHALALIALVGGLSVFVYGGPIWRLSNVARLQIVAAVLAYIIAVVTIAVRPRLQRHAFLWLVVSAVCTSGVMVLALVLAGRIPSTIFIMLALAATVALGSVPWLSARGRAALAVVVAVSAGAFYMRQSGAGMTMGPAMTRNLRVSALATLDMKFYRGYVPKPRNDGGAVVPVGNGFLLVDGDGRFSQLAWNDAFDGINARPAMPQDPAADYGKTLLIDLESGEKQVFSIGHRTVTARS